MKPPGAERHDPANREPPRAKEVGGASQRVPDLHVGRQDRPALLEQEGDARRNGAGEGEGESGDHADDRSLATAELEGLVRTAGHADSTARTPAPESLATRRSAPSDEERVGRAPSDSDWVRLGLRSVQPPLRRTSIVARARGGALRWSIADRRPSPGRAGNAHGHTAPPPRVRRGGGSSLCPGLCRTSVHR